MNAAFSENLMVPILDPSSSPLSGLMAFNILKSLPLPVRRMIPRRGVFAVDQFLKIPENHAYPAMTRRIRWSFPPLIPAESDTP
jgi:hypothetical protein